MSLIKALTHAIKKVLEHYPDQNKGISFLVASAPKTQGSSTLLKQSPLHHINIEQEPNLHLYYNTQGIIFEINQQWLEHSSIPLLQLFKKVNRLHRRLKISGFLFFIDIGDLIHEDHSQQNKDIKKHIQHIHSFLDALDYPVRSGLVITKLDQITGFTDFYSNCHEKELEEPLGFSLAYTRKHPKFKSLFSETWSNFVSSLNHSMTQKIHTTRANKKRILIREFPLQIAVLENRFYQIIKNITHPKAHIHGIYFTCAEQKGKNLNYLNHKIQNTFALTVSIQSIQSVNFKPFFIQGALQHCLEISTYIPKPSQFNDQKNLSIIGFGIICSIWILYQTAKSYKIIKESISVNNKFYLLHQSNPITKLTILENKLKALGDLPFIFRANNQINTLSNSILTSERQVFQESIVNNIIRQLQHEIQNKDLAKSFDAFMTYAALVNHKEEQSEHIIKWVSSNVFNSNSNDKNHEKALFTRFLWQLKWPTDHTLIQSTQALYQALPREYLIYQIISHKLLEQTIEVNLVGFNQAHLFVPKAYTKNAYELSKSQIISEIQKIKQYRWLINLEIDEKITNKIISTYQKQYVQWWKQLAHHATLKHFNNFDEAQTLFKILAKEKTIEKLINLIGKETAPNQATKNDDFNLNIASHFSDLHFATNQEENLHLFWNQLKKFTHMFLMIDNHGQASFQYMRSFFNQTQYNDSLYTIGEMAKHLPEPSSLWLQQIHEDMWLSILQSSKSYINQMWLQNVYSIYTKDIAGLYPFENSKDEISLSKFQEFFGPNGILQNFYREYLQAFINTNQAQWNTKQTENKQLPINEEMIQALMQANVINSMFFANNSSNINIVFSIEKMNLDPIINRLELNIGNQQLIDQQQENVYQNNLQWPSLNASLKIHTIDGENFQLEETGYWAFFKLLQQVNVIPDPNDPSALQVLLEINGNTGRYLIKTNNMLNPFSPGIFNGFKLNQNIID